MKLNNVKKGRAVVVVNAMAEKEEEEKYGMTGN